MATNKELKKEGQYKLIIEGHPEEGKIVTLTRGVFSVLGSVIYKTKQYPTGGYVPYNEVEVKTLSDDAQAALDAANNATTAAQKKAANAAARAAAKAAAASVEDEEEEIERLIKEEEEAKAKA